MFPLFEFKVFKIHQSIMITRKFTQKCFNNPHNKRITVQRQTGFYKSCSDSQEWQNLYCAFQNFQNEMQTVFFDS